MTLAMGYLRDPVLRLLPGEPPETFLALPPDEQAWRGRFFLMAWILTRNEPFSWDAALADDPDLNRQNRELVAATPDERILAELRHIYDQPEAPAGG